LEPLIRRATIEDAAAIAHVHVESTLATYRGIMPDAHLARVDVGQRERAWRQNLADPGHFVVVAEVDGSIVGFADAGESGSDAAIRR